MGRQAKLIEARLCAFLALIVPFAVCAEQQGAPSLELFVESLVESIRPDGHLDFSTFNCSPGLRGVSFCEDKLSGVGFRWSAEEFGETVYVPIFLAVSDPAAGRDRGISGRISVPRLADVAHLRSSFSSLHIGTALQHLAICPIELTSEPDDGAEAIYFTFQNPVNQTLVLLMYDGPDSPASEQENLLPPQRTGFPVGFIMVTNNLNTPCN